ncbi:MAG: hypothetical protein PHN32_02965 [Actinomycetota bacterium]|nr:hypothetical protein [Actinomycetota bacterium]
MKKQGGNATILVLIMAIAIVIGIMAMISFVFRDINFTKIDEENLRALNLAEAGIANFQYQLKLHLEGIQELPELGYSQNVIDEDSIEGSYTLNYEQVYEGETLSGYDVVSTGIDSSQRQRTIKVFINIEPVMPINIYEYIYSAQSINYGDLSASGTSIIGPFFTNGDLNLTGGVSFIRGPLHVHGNILLGGNSSIGQAEEPIQLYLSGTMKNINGQTIDPLNPGGLGQVYVSQLFNQPAEMPMLTIDDSYLQSLENKVVIDGDLTINEGRITAQGVDSHLFFDNQGILNIDGNVVVNGKVTIGSKIKAPYTVYYKGKGKIISTGDIIIYHQLITADDFPQQSLLILLSTSDINLDFGKSAGKPDGRLVAVSTQNIKLEENTEIVGSIIGKHLEIDNNSTIYYEPMLKDYLPQDLPQSQIGLDSNLIIENWQEIRNQ